jgi:hypothetical protein
MNNVMLDPQQPFGSRERRRAIRYAVAMRMEIWPKREERLNVPCLVSTRDISLQGIYFFTDDEPIVGSSLNFSVTFLRQSIGEDADLINGVARILRCEDLPDREAPRFGVAMVIEKTSYLHGQ